MPVSPLSFFVAQVMCAVMHLHDVGVIHKDIKVRNVYGGRSALSRFGSTFFFSCIARSTSMGTGKYCDKRDHRSDGCALPFAFALSLGRAVRLKFCGGSPRGSFCVFGMDGVEELVVSCLPHFVLWTRAPRARP